MMPRIELSRVEDLVAKKRFGIALLIVIAVHLLLIWLWKHSASEPDAVQPPDLVIDLGQAPPAGAIGDGANQPAPVPPSTPPSVKPPPSPAPAPADARAPSRPVSQLPAAPSESATSANTSAATPPSTSPAAEPAPRAERAVPREVAPQAPQTAQEQEATANAAMPAAAGSAKAANDAVRTAEADYKAAYLNNPRPAYPRMAHRMGIEGTVILLADVNEEGLPVQVRVFQSSGNDLLDQSALSAVNQWRFSPAKKDGVIVRSLVKIPITFSLKTQAKK